MSQRRNGSPTKWIGDCSLYGARRNRNRRHKKERRTALQNKIIWVHPEHLLGLLRHRLVRGFFLFRGLFIRWVYPNKPFKCSINSSLSFLSCKKGLWCVKESLGGYANAPSVICHICSPRNYLCLLCMEYKVAHWQTRLCKKNKDIKCNSIPCYKQTSGDI